MRSLNYILIVVFLLSSCQKQSAPLVTIITPTNEQLFHVGDSVKVKAELYDPDILIGEYLTVVSGTNYSDTIIKFEDHTQQGTYMLAKQFQIQNSDTVKIIVGAFGGSSILINKTVFIRIQ